MDGSSRSVVRAELGMGGRCTEKAPSGQSAKLPPRWEPSSAANTLAESRSGKHHQSIDPSAATSATVRPSPIAAYSRIDAYRSRRTR